MYQKYDSQKKERNKNLLTNFEQKNDQFKALKLPIQLYR